MSIKTTKLNNDRLNGNKLFLHTFKNFSTNSIRKSFKIYVIQALLTIFVLLSIVYIAVVVAIIFNIVNKKEGLATINDTNVKITKLEREYNSLISNLSKDYALNNGFINATDNYFASRKDDAAGLSFLYEEIGDSN